ncbi:MAG: GNAT family N-acetyltransferase [Gemmatimonadaceae bacterium]
MTLTVLNVAYPLAPVTPESVGGAEQVLGAIDAALVERGISSLVIACEGSRPRGHLLGTALPTGVFDETTCLTARETQARVIAEALDRFPVDVVHMHGVDFHEYLPPPGVPVLATLHLAHCWYPARAIEPSRPDTFVHCVSESQRRFFPPSPAMLSTIRNGVAIPTARPVRRRRGVAALGRICPEKGFHLALDAARRANVAMTLAGHVFAYPAHREYFESEIRPRLSLTRRFVGPLGSARKQAFLAEARCLLVPSLVPETSSLVAMEALAAGTPVVAFPSGALVEIVDHGVTGFLVHNEYEMADAIVAAGDLDPEACRSAAVERFSVSAMTRRYIERYTELSPASRAPMERLPNAPGVPIVVDAGRSRATTLERAELRSVECLEEVADDWARLCTIAASTPFQRPEWILPWWRHFGVGALRVITVRRAGELVGLAPLYVRPDARLGSEITFIGSGNSDYVDIVAHPAHGAAVARSIVDWITSVARDWERCELGPLRSTSPLLTAALPNGWRWARSQWDTCPLLRITGRSSSGASAVPARLYAQLQYERRRLARSRALEVEHATRDSAAALFQLVCRLHAARWQGRGGGTLADGSVRRFHAEVAPAMAKAGALRLHVLRVDGQPVAAFYGFADANRWYYYLGGFDPELSRYSVGSLAILHAIEQASAEGATEFDFLRGAEAYKYRWGAVDQPVYGCRLTRQVSSAREEEAA